MLVILSLGYLSSAPLGNRSRMIVASIQFTTQSRIILTAAVGVIVEFNNSLNVADCSWSRTFVKFLFSIVFHYTSAAKVSFCFSMASYKRFRGLSPHPDRTADLHCINIFTTFMDCILRSSLYSIFRAGTQLDIWFRLHKIYFAHRRWIVFQQHFFISIKKL